MHEELEVLMVFESYLAAAVDRVFKYVDAGVLFFPVPYSTHPSIYITYSPSLNSMPCKKRRACGVLSRGGALKSASDPTLEKSPMRME